MAWSTPDLTDITLVLKGLLDQALQNPGLPAAAANIKTNCDSPETVRTTGSQCFLSLYMLHVGRDPFWRNTPVSGPRPQLNSAQPLSLNLSYLLTAFCEKNFAQEQLAMSIALQAIHSNPIMTQAIIQSDPQAAALPEGEFVVSIEADTIDEMSRLWQAFTVPIRLSALIRASVVFIDPAVPQAPVAQPPSVANLAVAPQALASATLPLLAPSLAQISPPVAQGADPSTVTATTGPPVATGGVRAANGSTTIANGGSTLAIAGNGLDLALASNVFLSVPGAATEWDVTIPWRQGVAPGELALLLPFAYAAPGSAAPFAATETPLPGLYNLAVGSGATRSNTIAIAIAPLVNNVSDPPVLGASGGVYTIDGAGFIPGATTLGFGATTLAYTAGAPAAGEFAVNPAGTEITFVAPNSTKGSYPLLLAVNGIAASTGWVVVLP